MHSRRLGWALGVSMMAALGGCPSATTRIDDAGNDAAGRVDGAGTDASSSDDAATTVDVGPQPSWNSCSVTSDCGLVSMGCCSPCGSPTLDQLDPINLTQRDAHFMDVCPAPTPCPRCATGTNPNLVATCRLAHCTGVDISMTALSACTADTDCVIRYANCCSCSGDASQVVSVRVDAESAVEQLLCDGGACPLDCAPRMDPGFHAVCDPTTRHCTAVPLTP